MFIIKIFEKKNNKNSHYLESLKIYLKKYKKNCGRPDYIRLFNKKHNDNNKRRGLNAKIEKKIESF